MSHAHCDVAAVVLTAARLQYRAGTGAMVQTVGAAIVVSAPSVVQLLALAVREMVPS